MKVAELQKTTSVLHYKGPQLRCFDHTIQYVTFEGLWEGERPEDLSPSVYREYGMCKADWDDLGKPQVITVTVMAGDKLNER